MVFNNGNYDYRINFKHRIEIGGFDDDNVNITFCTVEKVETGKQFKDNPCTIGQGSAFCDPRDQFNKETGRKIALTRAVQNLDKNERKIIWTGYFNR
jgi:hypothetical protein